MRGFTLIELSIVLVIVGLLVGGVLVGRELINAAGVRAQVSQIEKYQQATNAFRVKYGYFPGDLPNNEAIRFGFAARGPYPGQGDGNEIISGNDGNAANSQCNYGCPFLGESAMFWVDLSVAKLVEGNFTTATPTALSPAVNGTGVAAYFPLSIIQGHVYVWSGGYQGFSTGISDRKNYFSITYSTGTNVGVSGLSFDAPALTVQQAYNIDKKIDDGLPQFGNILAMSDWGWASGSYLFNLGALKYYGVGASGASGTPVQSGSGGITTAASTTTCYDNGSVSDATEQYSVTYNGGRGLNCSLSFQFK